MHVFVDGGIAEEGGPELAEELEANGYDKYVKASAWSTRVVEPVETTRSTERRKERA